MMIDLVNMLQGRWASILTTKVFATIVLEKAARLSWPRSCKTFRPAPRACLGNAAASNKYPRNDCSEKLASIRLFSETLRSAQLCFMHGYAQVRARVYTHHSMAPACQGQGHEFWIAALGNRIQLQGCVCYNYNGSQGRPAGCLNVFPEF